MYGVTDDVLKWYILGVSSAIRKKGGVYVFCSLSLHCVAATSSSSTRHNAGTDNYPPAARLGHLLMLVVWNMNVFVTKYNLGIRFH